MFLYYVHSPYEVNVILISLMPNPKKDYTKVKLQPILLINIFAKFLCKKRIQQLNIRIVHIIRIFQYEENNIICHHNRSKGKNYRIMSRGNKVIWQSDQPFLLETFNKIDPINTSWTGFLKVCTHRLVCICVCIYVSPKASII